jgi:hypothetical protein
MQDMSVADHGYMIDILLQVKRPGSTPNPNFWPLIYDRIPSAKQPVWLAYLSFSALFCSL